MRLIVSNRQVLSSSMILQIMIIQVFKEPFYEILIKNYFFVTVNGFCVTGHDELYIRLSENTLMVEE